MNQDHLSRINNYINMHREVIILGSIEEASLHTAATMMEQGQVDIAQQIVNSLLIDEKIKQECIQVLSGEDINETTLVATTEEHPAMAISSEIETRTLSFEVPTPTSVPAAIPMPPTPPLGPAPIVMAPTTQDSTGLFSEETRLDSSEEILNPQSPLDTSSFAKEPEPMVLDAGLQEISPLESISISHNSSTNDDVWERFNAILAEEKIQSKTKDAPSHLERLEQLSGGLEQAGNTVEETQEKQITEDYDKVFGGDAHTKSFDVPGIIKTYETAQSSVDKEEKQKEQHLAERLDIYKKYFDAAEKYLSRAYASGNKDIMASASAQFQSLQERYPEYVQERSAHIADMQKIIDTYTHQRIESIAHDSFQLDENTIIAPGMRVTGVSKAYVIASITQATQDHEAEITFISDPAKSIYVVPASALSSAFTNVELDADDFFKDFVTGS